MGHTSTGLKKPNLFTAIALSVGTMIGSGWLYASYYASQVAGPASIISWIVGALLILIMAFLLAEIAVKHPTNGLFTKLITISHNQHFGFVTALSNWVLGLIVVPSEAMATTQYLASVYAPVTSKIFSNGSLTDIGILIVIFFMVLYTLINYWGLKALAKISNSLTTLKVLIPVVTSFIVMFAAFHSSNFTLVNHSFMPYGTSSVFSAIVTSGIFYSFFGFQTAATFSAELDNPKRNVPIALISSVLIVLAIYLLLQVSFIGAVPSHMLANGWTHLNFTSPLAQLAGILGLNALVVVLYADSIVSPSGTGLIYIGSTTRMLNEMAKEKQMPSCFAKVTPKINISRTSLIFTFACSVVLVFFFRNWKMIASLTTTFIMISSIALPVAYAKLKANKADPLPISYLPFSRIIAFGLFLFLAYLLMVAGVLNIAVALVLHLAFFVLYSFVNGNKSISHLMKSFLSSWVIFAMLIFELIAAIIHSHVTNFDVFYAIFLPLSGIMYYIMVNQKDYLSKD